MTEENKKAGQKETDGEWGGWLNTQGPITHFAKPTPEQENEQYNAMVKAAVDATEAVLANSPASADSKLFGRNGLSTEFMEPTSPSSSMASTMDSLRYPPDAERAKKLGGDDTSQGLFADARQVEEGNDMAKNLEKEVDKTVEQFGSSLTLPENKTPDSVSGLPDESHPESMQEGVSLKLDPYDAARMRGRDGGK